MINSDLINKTSFPLHFRFPLFTRYFTLILGILVILYSLFFIFTQINADTSKFQKFLPFIIIFFAFDSVSRNLFTVNKISLFKDKIEFSYLAKKKVVIFWENVKKLESYQEKGKFFVIHYLDASGTIKKHFFPMAFKNIIDIINYIANFNEKIEMDEFVSSLVFIQKTKEDTNEKKD